MGEGRGCPHCTVEGRPRDYGWSCHRRVVERTPERGVVGYGVRGVPYADHGDDCLYRHGPGSEGGSVHDLVTDVLAQEVMELDAGYGARLHGAQTRQSRYNLVQFLALAPHLWGYVKLKMAVEGTPPKQRAEIRQWLKEAREMRVRLIRASEAEAARLVHQTPEDT